MVAAQAQGEVQGGPAVYTFKNFMDCKPHAFSGLAGAVGLLHWIEIEESMFSMCNCPNENKVMFTTGTLEKAALTWWSSQVKMMRLNAANALTWAEFNELLKEEYNPRDEVQKLEQEFWNLRMDGSEIETYTNRSHELAVLCPQMVNPAYKRIERYIDGLVPQIQGMVTSSRPTTIEEAIFLAHKLTEQAIKQGALPPKKSTAGSSENKHKCENNNNHSHGNKNQGGYQGQYPRCKKCNLHHIGQCEKVACQHCGKSGHEARICREELKHKKPQAQEKSKKCYECGQEGHFRPDCLKLKNKNNGGNNNNGKDNNGEKWLNGCPPLTLFDTATDLSFICTKFCKIIEHNPSTLESNYLIELSNGKTVQVSQILIECKLVFSTHAFYIDLNPIELGSFDVVICMDWLSMHQAEVGSHEKVVRIIVTDGEVLTVQGEECGTAIGVGYGV
ncbi:uncharacterized protein LOC143597045 [Bidens hawaiensis]|uniref:uncharacterized protein LOC143597045 n=1 Tax=Bidens hawaiensis TaxID=980011 RepID=UPI00404B8361